LHAGQRLAVAGAAGRQPQRRIALGDELLGPRTCGRVGGPGLRWRVRQVQRREVRSQLTQEVVAQRFQQMRHQRVLAATIAKGQQLFVQIARRLAGDARVIAIGRGAALLAMAAGAGPGAARQGVVGRRSGAGQQRGQQQEQRAHRVTA
jgi:hypothetical protein